MTNPAGLVAMVPSENDAANWRRWSTGFTPQKPPHFSSGIFLLYIFEIEVIPNIFLFMHAWLTCFALTVSCKHQLFSTLAQIYVSFPATRSEVLFGPDLWLTHVQLSV